MGKLCNLWRIIIMGTETLILEITDLPNDQQFYEAARRIVQMMADNYGLPVTKKTDHYRNAWRMLGEGSPAQAALIMKTAFGVECDPKGRGTLTKNLIDTGDLEKVGPGMYRWIGSPTYNTQV